MEWEVRFTDELGAWWDGLTADEQESVNASVILFQKRGPNLGFPHSSGVAQSRYSHMRELRIQHAGRPYRVLYAFDPERSAILLTGTDKSGNDRWYDVFVPRADKLYAEYLRERAQTQEKRNDTKLQGVAAKDAARIAGQKRGKGHRNAKGHGPR
jgi:hypothetical protein